MVHHGSESFSLPDFYCTSYSNCPGAVRQTTDFTPGCAWLRLALSLWRTKVHAARMRPRGHSGATKGQTIHRNKKHTPGLNISQLLKLQKIQKIQLLGNHNGWQSANVSRLTRNNLLLVAEAPKMVSSQVVTVEKSYVISTSVAVTLKLGKYKVLSKLE